MTEIAALILAAGLSKRMGQPKMFLPWGNVTVLEKSIETFTKSGIQQIIVVTGENTAAVQELLHRTTSAGNCEILYNPNYGDGEMVNSIKVGLSAVNSMAGAAFIALGDHPQLDPIIPARMLEAYEKQFSDLIIPSFQNRRGHPWLVGRPLFGAILGLGQNETMRTFIQNYQDSIHYIEGNESILKDLDTPEDYRRDKP
jgi:molybdenum cofactor cytidylyltransferase